MRDIQRLTWSRFFPFAPEPLGAAPGRQFGPGVGGFDPAYPGAAAPVASPHRRCAMSYIVGLDHVTIQVDDGDEALRQALRFYVGLLGLAPLDRPPQHG